MTKDKIKMKGQEFLKFIENAQLEDYKKTYDEHGNECEARIFCVDDVLYLVNYCNDSPLDTDEDIELIEVIRKERTIREGYYCRKTHGREECSGQAIEIKEIEDAEARYHGVFCQ